MIHDYQVVTRQNGVGDFVLEINLCNFDVTYLNTSAEASYINSSSINFPLIYSSYLKPSLKTDLIPYT